MSNSHFKELLQAYLTNTLSAGQLKEFTRLLQKQSNQQAFQQAIDDALADKSFEGILSEEKADLIFQDILDKAQTDLPPKTIPLFTWRRIAVAAVILVAAGTSIFYFLTNKKTEQPVAVQPSTPKKLNNDIAPASDKAILTLADGTQIVLDDAANGDLTQQGNATVIKLDGKLAYNHAAASSSTEILYNTITTAKGKQYQLVLADGTIVWLNAGSSLRFPTTFTGNERNVALKGEGYFEVAKNAAAPFHVSIPGRNTTVEVLGTHFNINAYDDETSIKTTLLEGSVRLVKAGGQTAMLKPGQQGKTDDQSAAIQILKNINTDQAVAWRTGLFDFDGDNIDDIMRQLSRWYDMEVSYGQTIPQQHFTGSIRRQVNLSEVLHMLEVAGGIKFTINGKKVTVRAN